MRDIERLPECDAIIRELAELMVRLHSAGVLVKDFSPGNVLYRTDAEGRRRYMLVDINRMRFDVHDHEEQMTMFARLLNTEELTERLAHYAAATALERHCGKFRPSPAPSGAAAGADAAGPAGAKAGWTISANCWSIWSLCTRHSNILRNFAPVYETNCHTAACTAATARHGRHPHRRPADGASGMAAL